LEKEYLNLNQTKSFQLLEIPIMTDKRKDRCTDPVPITISDQETINLRGKTNFVYLYILRVMGIHSREIQLVNL